MIKRQGEMMKPDVTNWTARTLALLLALSAVAADQRLEAVKTAPEPAPQQPPANNWFNARTPGRGALAQPNSFLQYGHSENDNCCPGRRCGHYLHRIVAWATYCPKYHVCACTQCCNSCQYKGVLPLYPIFYNPKCIEGSGIQATFANECYRGNVDCATCGHH
ncbi:MAG TPA: hypothetical protein VH592_12345 [Gemmataceae bacterium]|jgi:hypothetical protein